ncbi:KinB-signaling pathway activation protein [Paenibacillus aquistagni]|nr:KinB-signaling pathway activation protein [Paenibacillus aquistagni]
MKKWLHLFWTSICVGGGLMLLTGLSIQLFQQELSNMKGAGDILINVLQLIFSGFMISVYAQMGFFAYLTLNYIALGFFKKSWLYIQVIITVFVLLDVMFLRTMLGGNGKLQTDIILGLALLAIAYIVAKFKVRATNKAALIPTMFFMIAGTAVETLSALNISNVATWFVFIPLVACNAHQILILHRLVGQKGNASTVETAGAAS